MKDAVLPELDSQSVTAVPAHAHEQRPLHAAGQRRRRSGYVHLFELEPNQATREPRIQQSVGLRVDLDHDLERARVSRGSARCPREGEQAKETD
jgi:hypothetical protein